MHMSHIIRSRRLAAGLTQEQVATRLGISAPAVNKWERGVSYPDITLIPALARLLETDANTLLSFEADLTPEHNLAIQRETERLVREEGFEAGFAYAQEQLRIFPASDELAIVLTGYLDGALTLYQVPEPERWRGALDTTYERLAASSTSAVRDQAISLLVAQATARGDYECAQQLLDRLPSATVDKQAQQATLHMKQEHYEQAGRLWEARLTKAVGDCIAALAGLSEIALRRDAEGEAADIARRARPIAEACDLPRWMTGGVELRVAAAQQDADASMVLLEELVSSACDTAPAIRESPLHRLTGTADIAPFAQQVCTLILNEVATDPAYAYLREEPAVAARLDALLAKQA